MTFETRLTGGLHGQLRAAWADTRGRVRDELGLSLWSRTSRGRFGLAYDRQGFDSGHGDELALFGELDSSERLTVAGTLGVEHRRRHRGGVVAGFALRLYPQADLMIESGFGLRGRRRGIDAHDVDMLLALEYAPGDFGRRGWSLFAEHGYDGDRDQVGLRWQLGGSARTLRERHREGPVRLSRP